MAWTLDLTVPDIYTDNTVQGNVHNALEPPYPSAFWFVTQDNDITHQGALLDIHNAFQPPYPSSYWFVDNNDVVHDGELMYEEMGAFRKCSNFSKIVIPVTTKSLGDYSFDLTALTEVQIASDCTYYPTTFPEECEVTFYEG